MRVLCQVERNEDLLTVCWQEGAGMERGSQSKSHEAGNLLLNVRVSREHCYGSGTQPTNMGGAGLPVVSVSIHAKTVLYK